MLLLVIFGKPLMSIVFIFFAKKSMTVKKIADLSKIATLIIRSKIQTRKT